MSAVSAFDNLLEVVGASEKRPHVRRAQDHIDVVQVVAFVDVHDAASQELLMPLKVVSGHTQAVDGGCKVGLRIEQLDLVGSQLVLGVIEFALGLSPACPVRCASGPL